MTNFFILVSDSNMVIIFELSNFLPVFYIILALAKLNIYNITNIEPYL